jgi:hypothetical protein
MRPDRTMNDAATLGTTISLPEPSTGWFVYSSAVLADGTLALLRTDSDVHTERARWRARARRGHMPQPKRVRLSTFDGTMESKAIEVPVEFVPVFSRLADGRWLVAEAWDEGEKNTRLYTPDGAPDGAFSMGEGILYIRCAPDATIWVGYFDEGVFAGPNDGGTWPTLCFSIA